jgi:hypothetical protein
MYQADFTKSSRQFISPSSSKRFENRLRRRAKKQNRESRFALIHATLHGPEVCRFRRVRLYFSAIPFALLYDSPFLEQARNRSLLKTHSTEGKSPRSFFPMKREYIDAVLCTIRILLSR